MITIHHILEAEALVSGTEAVIFDLDDTLYPEKAYVKSGYRAVSRLFENSEQVFSQLWEAFCQGKPAIDSVLGAMDAMDRKEEAIHIYRFHRPDIILYPGVSEMMGRLGKTRKLGIITDGRPEGQRAKLEALGVTADEIIITDELGGPRYRKPCEAAFRLMQERLQVPFSRMVYIGDNPKKDFIAPESLGMQTIYFKNPDGLYSGRE